MTGWVNPGNGFEGALSLSFLIESLLTPLHDRLYIARGIRIRSSSDHISTPHFTLRYNEDGSATLSTSSTASRPLATPFGSSVRSLKRQYHSFNGFPLRNRGIVLTNVPVNITGLGVTRSFFRI